MRLNPSLAYRLEQIDPGLDAARDEGEARLVPVRALLRCAAKSCAGLLDPACESSVGAMLSRGQAAEALRVLLEAGCAQRPRACLILGGKRLVGVDEADELDEASRASCVAVQASDRVAMPVAPQDREPPRVLLTFRKDALGGAREAKLDAALTGEHEVTLNTISTTGVRRRVVVRDLPKPLLDKLFARSEAAEGGRTAALRRNEVPEYLKGALVDFLERRVRLQALCTAAVPGPATRPVVLDRVYTRSSNADKRNQLSIGASLHPSSSSCVCGAHGLRFDWAGCVEVRVETCGRKLERHGECTRCPCHERALDESGNSRFNIEGICTEGTTVSVACFHRQGKVCKRGVCVDCVRLTDADRLELSTMLINLDEFNFHAETFFDSRGAAKDSEQLESLSQYMADKLQESMEHVQRLQLSEQDPEVHNPRELLRRDMVAVDLMRGGGVFRHVHKGGVSRGCPYLKRAVRNDKTPPLKTHEAALVDTHSHLFRKSNVR